MKFFLSLILLIPITFSVSSQQVIEIKEIPSGFKDARFYVDHVKDVRLNKNDIGEIKTGAFKKPFKIDANGGFLNASEKYFKMNFPKKSDHQVKVEILIKKAEVKQGVIKSMENGIAIVVLEFKYDNRSYETKAEIYDEVEDAFSTHEERIRRAFYECAVQFNNTLPIEDEHQSDDTYKEDALEIVFDGKNDDVIEKYVTKKEKVNSEKRNLIVIGYQIGGYSLVGVEYEYRLPGYIGFNIGGGLFGYTGGIKVHTSKRRNSPFFSLSWKDGGLGLMNGVAVETGGRWIWAKSKDFGLLAQTGIFFINYIDSDYEQILFGGQNAPPIILSIGIGLSW